MANQRILYTEEMVGDNHPTKADTLNRLAMVEHNEDGTHDIINAMRGVFTPTGNAVGLEIDNDGTNHGLFVHQDGVLAALDYGVYVYSNADQDNSALVYIHNANGSSSQPTLQINANTTDSGIVVDQTGSSQAIEANANNSGGHAAIFFNDGDNVDRKGIQIQSGKDDQTGTTSIHVTILDGDGGSEGGIEVNSGTLQFFQNSDARLKTGIVPTTIDGLAICSALEVDDWYWAKNPVVKKTGFIAHKAKNVYPSMVSEKPDKIESTQFKHTDLTQEDLDKNPPLSSSDSVLIPVLVKAIQQLTARIEALEQG